MLALPKNREEIELEMSNYDQVIDEGFAEILMGGNVYGRHSAWDFNGKVWFQDGKFHEAIWVYRSHVETMSADTLEELMQNANNAYGWK